jgi:hypothetical protein
MNTQLGLTTSSPTVTWELIDANELAKRLGVGISIG